MASMDDQLNATKNGVLAVSNLYLIQRRISGTATSGTVATDTLIVAGAGRLVNCSVIAKGSAQGGIYDALSIALAVQIDQLCTIDDANVGVFPLGLEFTNGLVVKPGTGQILNVTYSVG